MKLQRIAVCLLLLASTAGSAEPRGGPEGIFRTDVPREPFSLILGRPAATAITVSVVSAGDLEGYVCYGIAGDARTNRTEMARFTAGQQRMICLDGLAANASCWYVFHHRPVSATVFSASAAYGFRTQRAPGEPFTFTVTADSHLDENTDPAIYARTLRGALRDEPDFHMELGDTFMTGKRRDKPEAALPQYLAQRHYFGMLCASTPLFLVLGNHDGESGRTVETAACMRTGLFPNPVADSFYTGSPGGNYYAWNWGDALFVVLDPYRYSGGGARGRTGGGWAFTLGRQQYDWLQATLQSRKVRFTFVFIHQLVGGLDRQGRGGAEAVPFLEWGGRDPDGRTTFAEQRPGWPMPIHELLRKHGVTAVFHGHDHFYARQEVDGILYQLVPQPGHPGAGSHVRAREYGYLSGDIQPGAGYLRVNVSATGPAIAFVRTE